MSRYSADLGQLISRQRAEKALRASALESAIANRAKSEFIANMSYELRTPLNAIIGFSGIIERLPALPENEKTIDYAGHIARAGAHLLDVINDILDISKIESGKFELSCDEVSIHEIASASADMVRARIAQKHQRFDMMLSERLPPVWADGRRLKQVLINLLSNAHKFTPEGGRICLIATADRKHVTIAVSDTGTGMDEEQIHHALKPFEQVKSQYTRDQEGTGLGLPIAKALIELHEGGRFVVSSKPGAGTTVAFTLVASEPRPLYSEPAYGFSERTIRMSSAANSSRELGREPGDRPIARAARAHIARIVSVSGAQAVAMVDRDVQAAHQTGEDRIEIGALMKIASQRTVVMGVVSAVSIPVPDMDSGKEPMGLIELNLAREISIDRETMKPQFRRGVTSIPTIGDPIQLADRSDLTLVYAQPNRDTIVVGSLFQDPSVPARLLTNDLFGKHFTIVGTTGCGKSSALTGILQAVLQDHRQAHIVVLDIHNEYGAAFGDKAEQIDPSNLHLPFWLLNFQELSAALVSTDEHRDAEAEILSDAVLQAKRRYSDAQAGRLRKAADSSGLTVDTPSPFRLSDIVAYVDEHLGKLERTQGTLAYKRLKARIEALVGDPRYAFMFGGLVVEDTMTEVLGRIFRVPIAGKPICVLNLATVPVEILDVVISLISRLAFDIGVWSDGGLPILIVCEEAHRYAPADTGGNAFAPTRAALSRIAKEGRKYGVSLALVTQRPSELDPTILSQCSTAIAMRLSTERDQNVMRANTHEGALDLLDFLPLLGDREAIVLGQGVPMPVRLKFNTIAGAQTPQTRHTGFDEAWKTASMSPEELEEVVRRWRLSVRSKTWA